MEVGLIATLLLVLGVEFLNGWTDAPNAIATVVSTRTLTLRKAIVLAVTGNVLGAMAGTAVAKTIGAGIIKSDVIDLTTVASAMLAIMIWGLIAWKLALPISKSHSLIASLTGAGLATAGPQVLLWEGWLKVGIGLFFSTFLGLIVAYLFTKLVRRLAAPFPPRATKPMFRSLQVISSGFMALAHGSNDGQKFIGVFTLTLLLGGRLDTFSVPFWVVALCAGVMGLGTSFGGWRIIRTMGVKMVHIETYQGFCAETSAGAIISLASFLNLPIPFLGKDFTVKGVPLSTTHTIGTSIMGTAIARRFSALRLRIVKHIFLAWLLTFPICGALAFAITLLLRLIF